MAQMSCHAVGWNYLVLFNQGIYMYPFQEGV